MQTNENEKKEVNKKGGGRETSSEVKFVFSKMRNIFQWGHRWIKSRAILISNAFRGFLYKTLFDNCSSKDK